jgi:hypothetical protein
VGGTCVASTADCTDGGIPVACTADSCGSGSICCGSLGAAGGGGGAGTSCQTGTCPQGQAQLCDPTAAQPCADPTDHCRTLGGGGGGGGQGISVCLPGGTGGGDGGGGGPKDAAAD